MRAATTSTTTGADPDVAAMSITDSMISVDHSLSHLPAKTALELVEFCRRRLDASEARILADRYEKGASDRDVEDMAKGSDGKTSKAAAKKKARRAKAANANPGLADRLAEGDLSSEQVDVIADAADETDGEAACDEELIDTVAGTSPEQGKKKAREYVNKRRNADDVQKRFDRQRRNRGVYRHRLSNGNEALTIHGPTEHLDDIERGIHADSDTEYRQDGGRDVASTKHPRTRDQRNFDAAYQRFTQQQAGTQQHAKPTTSDSDRDTTDKGSSSHAAKPTATRPDSSNNRRAIIFITATIDQMTGKDPAPFTTVDGKPLPQSVVDELAGDAAFIAQVFSKDGELLWQGRKHRLATPAQINGLISRDAGCVQCGAHHGRCVVHHLLPWESPRKGPTNINNLVLLCTDCHVRLHRAKRTMFYDLESQTWNTRPATHDEIPPDGGPKPKPPPGKYRAKPANLRPEPGTTPRTKPSLHERQPKPGIRPKTETSEPSATAQLFADSVNARR